MYMLPLPESSRRFWNPAAASGFQLPLPQIIRYTNLDHTTGLDWGILVITRQIGRNPFVLTSNILRNHIHA